jgi:hypothetical protein
METVNVSYASIPETLFNKIINGKCITVKCSNCVIMGDLNFIDGLNNQINGNNNTIKGYYNTICGTKNNIQNDDNIIYGNDNSMNGNNNQIHGDSNEINGCYNKIVGDFNKINGLENEIIGDDNIVYGYSNKCQGKNNTIYRVNICIDDDSSYENDLIVKLRDLDFNNSNKKSFIFGVTEIDLKRDEEEKESEKACIICQERRPIILVKPCYHLKLCAYCAKDLKEKSKDIENIKCPCCMNKITKMKGIY